MNNEISETRKRLINHVHSVNNVLTLEYLNDMENNELLSNAHPNDRASYLSDFKDEKISLY